MHVVVVGHVDHGKSTLVGRLLHLSGSVDATAFARVLLADGTYDWSRLTDVSVVERDRKATLDQARVRLRTAPEITLIDVPGHREFLRNMLSGAFGAELALLVVAGDEGVETQTRAHVRILAVLGIQSVCLVISKTDLASPERVAAVKADAHALLNAHGIDMAKVSEVRKGDDQGLRTILDFLQEHRAKREPGLLRVLVRDVWELDGSTVVVASVRGGKLEIGDVVTLHPHRRRAIVSHFHEWGTERHSARDGDEVVLSFSENVGVVRGMVATRESEPPRATRFFRAVLCTPGVDWSVGDRLEIGLAGQEAVVDLEKIAGAEGADPPCIAEVELSSDKAFCVDVGRGALSLFTVLNDGVPVGIGRVIEVIASVERELTWELPCINRQARERSLGQTAFCVWLTGLSASGKSTLARRLDAEMHDVGWHTYVLDGDNLRQGVSRDLGFSPGDRSEHIRRVGEIARLFVDAGVVVIAAFISPSAEMRENVRRLLPEGRFLEVWVDAPVDVCAARDPKGLYAKAMRGDIPNFTGIDAPYEAPRSPEIHVKTAEASISESVAEILEVVAARFGGPSRIEQV